MSATQAWKHRVHNEDYIDIFRRLFDNSKGKSQEWALKRKEALESVSHAITPEEAQAYMKEAAQAAAMQGKMMEQESYFKNDLLNALNEKLHNLGHVDTRPVTSLGQYGYFMGEKNDTAQR